MQYFTHPKNSDFNQMYNAVDKLFNAFDFCYEIRVLGGEPFVNPELHKYIEMLLKYSSKCSWIIILTNATILPNEKTIEILKNQKIIVRISEYNNPRQKIAEFKSILDTNSIIYYVDEIAKWQDCAGLHDYGRSKIENENVLKDCCVNYTPTIVDGKFFRCPLAGNLYNLSAIPFHLHEYIDLLDNKIQNDDIKSRVKTLMNAQYLQACNYCGGRPFSGNSIPVAIQTDSPLLYTKYQKDKI
jgi:hypothetical protein